MQPSSGKSSGYQIPSNSGGAGVTRSSPAADDISALRASLIQLERVRELIADREIRLKETDAHLRSFSERITVLERELVAVRDMNGGLDARATQLLRENEVLKAANARLGSERVFVSPTKTAEAVNAAIEELRNRFGPGARGRISQLDAVIAHFAVTECLSFKKDLEEAIDRVGADHLHGIDRLIATQPIVDGATSGKVLRL